MGKKERKPLAYHLKIMIKYIEYALCLTETYDFDSFLSADSTSRLAIDMTIQRVGEAAKRIRPEVRAEYACVDWDGITGTRDIIAHMIDEKDKDNKIIWEIIEKDFPKMLSQLKEILEEANDLGKTK